MTEIGQESFEQGPEKKNDFGEEIFKVNMQVKFAMAKELKSAGLSSQSIIRILNLPGAKKHVHKNIKIMKRSYRHE